MNVLPTLVEMVVSATTKWTAINAFARVRVGKVYFVKKILTSVLRILVKMVALARIWSILFPAHVSTISKAQLASKMSMNVQRPMVAASLLIHCVATPLDPASARLCSWS